VKGAKKLLDVIIQLFKAASNEVSKLWSSLAFAKDCMMACIQHVLDAKNLCGKAKNTALCLIQKSSIVAQKLQSAGELDFGAIRSLARDGEIQDAVDLATNIDDEVLACTTQVLEMIQVVTDGFQKLPEILTKDLDMKEAGKQIVTDDGDDDDEFFRSLPDIENDVCEFESRSRALEDEDVFSASNTSISGFRDISSNTTEKCIQMITTLEAFANKCDGTIQSFLSIWNLDSAVIKINEMCRIISLGELMKEITNRIQRVMRVMKQYMMTVIKKFTTFPNGKFLRHGKEQIQKIKNAIDNIHDGCPMFRC
jgi:hypothetical protein